MFAENAGDLKHTWLDPARIDVAFRSKAEGCAANRTLENADQRRHDARVPDQKLVFLVPSFSISTLNKTRSAARQGL